MGKDNQRLRQAREKAGFRSASAAAKRFGWTVSTYLSHENGQSPVPRDRAPEYARAFKVNEIWLLALDDDDTMSEERKTTTLAGYVGAGDEIVPVGDSDLGDVVELPPGAPAGTTAVQVRGNSMYPRYMDGERLFYIADRTSPADLINRECVLQLADGRAFVKRLQKGSKKNLFHLESWNAPLMLDQRIKWAAPIRWTERK